MYGFSDEQRFYLKFMVKYLNFNLDQVRNDPSMINSSTNKPYQKRSINNWFERLKITGDVSKLPKTVRPKKLDKNEEETLLETIKMNPKYRYNKIRSKLVKS